MFSGCQLYLDDADRNVYSLIEKRQRDALGETHAAYIGKEEAPSRRTRSTYSFVPHPITPDIPDAFGRPAASASPQDRSPADRQPESSGSLGDTQTTQPNSSSSPTVDENRANGSETRPADDGAREAPEEPIYLGEPFPLSQALKYAMDHSRTFQDEKENLYLSALALTLERHLWTPQLESQISAEFADYGQIRDFDRAMEMVAQVSAAQRLPYGGQVTARILGVLMRDLGRHVTSGETGQVILTADIPLLRGAGKVAFESRYQAERDLIYAVRRFERFRTTFVVTVAGDYFRLLQLRAEYENAKASEAASLEDWKRAQALVVAERQIRLDADRANVNYLSVQNRTVDALAGYETALDRFKIDLGMPVTQSMDVVESDIELFEADVTVEEAIETGVARRLDLLNTLDGIDDAKRQVEIARNNMLPQFDLNGSVAFDTDPDQKSMTAYNSDRTTWRGMATLEIPIDRKEERNALRASLVTLRRAERAYEQSADEVRLEIRRALRGLEQQRKSLDIQMQNIEINVERRKAAEVRFNEGKLSNRDVIEAENDLRQAKNAYAAAVSNYRQAILEFRNATGALRVDDDGRWIDP